MGARIRSHGLVVGDWQTGFYLGSSILRSADAISFSSGQASGSGGLWELTRGSSSSHLSRYYGAVSYRDYEQAFQVMRSGNAGKVILEWS
jgi:hypothetical protein